VPDERRDWSSIFLSWAFINGEISRPAYDLNSEAYGMNSECADIQHRCQGMLAERGVTKYQGIPRQDLWEEIPPLTFDDPLTTSSR